MRQAIQSTLPGQDMRNNPADSLNPHTINPINESEGPNFFVMAGKRLKEIGFRFSTERDQNLIHFTKEIFKPDVRENIRGTLKVSYRLESPSFSEVAHQKDILKQRDFLEGVLSGEIAISDEEEVVRDLVQQSKGRYQIIQRKIEDMNMERLSFDVFIEIQYDDQPTKMVYKVVVHENLILIQHVTVIDQDQDLGILDLENKIYKGPRYESLPSVRYYRLINFITFDI